MFFRNYYLIDEENQLALPIFGWWIDIYTRTSFQQIIDIDIFE
jgi:hypothetical protein